MSYLGFNQIPEPEYVFFEESGGIFHFDVKKTVGAPIVQHPIDSFTPEKFEIKNLCELLLINHTKNQVLVLHFKKCCNRGDC